MACLKLTYLSENPFLKVVKGSFEADEKSSADRYRFGFNGQERVPEISSFHQTAPFWEYDPRLGRRWNLDPVPVPWESRYAANRNNPIWVHDPLGDFGKNPLKKDEKQQKRQERAAAKFEENIVKPLTTLDENLRNSGMSDPDVMKNVQSEANRLADKYQRTRWLHSSIRPYGQSPKNNTSRKKYVSTATGFPIQEVIAIKAYQQEVMNAVINNERPPGESMTTTGTTGIVAPPGATVNVKFNPLAVENSLDVSSLGAGGASVPIVTTGGMISDDANQLDVFRFNRTTVLTNSNAGEIMYRVQNTNPNADRDNWQLSIQVAAPPVLAPVPIVVSNYPYYP